MISRLRRIVARTRIAPARIDTLEHLHNDVVARLARLEGRMLQVTEKDVPGLFLAQEAALDGRVTALVRSAADEAERNAVSAARTHAEAAADNAAAAARAAAQMHAEAAADNAGAAARAGAQLHAEAAAEAALVTARGHAEELHVQTIAELKQESARLRREMTSLRRSGLSSTPQDAAALPHPTTSGMDVDPSFYAALEDRFRGDRAVILERQRAYLPLVVELADDEHPVLDLGCGRGEWLQVLGEAGIAAIGVDSNPVFVGDVGDLGGAIVEDDLVSYLHRARDESMGAITMFQVVEHLPLAVLLDVMAEAARVLVPGGVLIAETPNALNLRVAATTFWLDPTHQRPLHPELLKFIAEQVGFSKIDGWFLNELGDGGAADGEVARLVEMVDGPGDFSLIAWR